MKRMSIVWCGVLVSALVLAGPAMAADRMPHHGGFDRDGFQHGYALGLDHDHFRHGYTLGFGSPYWWGGGGWWWPGYDGFGYGAYYAYPQPGALKLDISGPDPKLAQVYTNGAYVGTENHFRGFFHELTLNPGRYTIQVRADGYKPLTVPVEIQPGRTITYKGQMHKAA